MGEVSAQTAQYTCTIAGKPYDVLGLDVTEEISRLFQINLSVWSDDPAESIAGWMRQPVVVTVAWGGLRREYHGIAVGCSRSDANQVGLGGVDKPWGEYTVEIAPTLTLLARQANCKVFQDKTAVEIITRVLDERGMAGKYELRLSGSYPPREYCVQYRETDLDFVSRLMEEEGLFYYFTHDGKEMMVIGDSPGAYGTCAPESSVEYKSESGVLSPTQEHISSATYSESVHTGKVRFKDFNYRLPTSPLRIEQLAEKHTDLEVYDYHPERYRDDGRGRALAKVRSEAEAVYRKTIRGAGNFRSLASGCKLTISKAYHPDINGEWLVVQATHAAAQQASTGVQYSTSFLAIPSSTTFRAYPETPRPTLTSQTATVVGPKGERIFMDELGRAKAQFDWDRDGTLDEDSSCWIRVAMPYAGIDPDTQAKHGFQWHPLIGDEVVVTFLESDPDRPVITGSVYNADRPPIIKPSELVRNVILTPYQHRILLDDARKRIEVTTGDHQELRMGDDDPHGWIELETEGEQYMYFQDQDDKYGNMIDIQTSDGHEVELIKCADGSHIRAWSEADHWMDINDTKQWLELASAKGHYVNLCDAEDDNCIEIKTTGRHCLLLSDTEGKRKMRMRTAGGHKLTLHDDDRYVVLRASEGGHVAIDDPGMYAELSSPDSDEADATEYVYIDWELHEVVITTTGTVYVTAGSVEISAGSVTVDASGDLTMKGKNVSIKGDSVSIEGGSVSVRADGDASVKAGSSLELSASGEVTIDGATVSSTAMGTNSLKGAVVKLN